MNRIYEEMFIVSRTLRRKRSTPFVEQLTSTVTSAGGTIDKDDKWGMRKLAYRVEKRDEGYYVLIQFTAGPQTVKEIERRLRVTDVVLKFLTVRIDEKLKRIEKRKKERDKRAARKPRRVGAAALRSARCRPQPAPGRTDARSTGARSARSSRAPACRRANRRRRTGVSHGGTKRRTTHRVVAAAHRRRQGRRAARSSISGARRFAGSASRRSTTSTTRTRKMLNAFVAERGKIMPRRISGVCAPHQRRLAEAIKQARNIALLPFAAPV